MRRRSTREGIGAVAVWLLGLGLSVLIGPVIGVLFVVLGGVLAMFALADSEVAQRVIPPLGRLPLVQDHGLVAQPKSEEVVKRVNPWGSGLSRTLFSIIHDAEQIKTRRAVSGDGWFVGAVQDWLEKADHDLEAANAGDLRDRWREDGVHAPHTANEYAEYLDRSLKLFSDARDKLSGGIPF